MSKVIISPAFSSEELNYVASFQKDTVILTNYLSVDECAVNANKKENKCQ